MQYEIEIFNQILKKLNIIYVLNVRIRGTEKTEIKDA